MITQTTTKTESNSIEVGRNAKGEYSYSVKVYADDLTSAQADVTKTDAWFRKEFLPSTTK